MRNQSLQPTNPRPHQSPKPQNLKTYIEGGLNYQIAKYTTRDFSKMFRVLTRWEILEPEIKQAITDIHRALANCEKLVAELDSVSQCQ